MVLKPWDHQELRTDKYKRRSVCRLSFGACNIQTLEERRHTQHRTLRRSCHWHRRKFKRLGYPEGRKNQGWIYQLYQRLLGGQVRWIMEFDHWLWKHGGLQWPWHQKFWVLGPHLDISSSAFAKRHSKNQWYQNHFISSRYVFEEHPELLHSCLSSTRGRYFSHQNTLLLNKWLNFPSSNSWIPVSFFALATSYLAPAWGHVFVGQTYSWLSLIFFILIFLVPFPCLPCVYYFNPLLMCAFLSSVYISGMQSLQIILEPYWGGKYCSKCQMLWLFIDTTGSWLRTCMHHDGEEIDLGMEPGDIYSSSGSATK